MYQPTEILPTYLPSASEVEPERVQRLREVLRLIHASVSPDLDLSPNSVFGDLMLTPSAVSAAVQEIAWERFLSDLDPANAAAGVVYNCEFTTAYLQSFGILRDDLPQAHALLRFEFIDARARELSRDLGLRLGESRFHLHAPLPGSIHLTLESPQGVNVARYAFLGEERWAVDLLAFGEGEATTQVVLDREVEGLVSIQVLGQIRDRRSLNRLQELARRLGHQYHSHTPVTRGGAENMIISRFPTIETVSATISGDLEMARSTPAGALDLHVRSDELIRDRVSLKLRPFTYGADTLFAGILETPETPILLRGGSSVFEVYSLGPSGGSVGYSRREKLMVLARNPEISARIDDQGVYGMFDLEYYFDPALKTAQDYAAGEHLQAVNVDLLVRGFVPCEISELAVYYNRRAGSAIDLTQARSEILTAFNRHSVYRPAGPADIVDSLRYAGAHSVERIILAARIVPSLAQALSPMHTEVPATVEEWDQFFESLVPVPRWEVSSIYEPEILNLDVESRSSSGTRNVSWLLQSQALKFIEHRSV